MTEQNTFMFVFSLGALCVLFGFFLVVRGIGHSDSESRIKLLGLEITTSRVGPGILFAVFGVVLIALAVLGPERKPNDIRQETAEPPCEADQILVDGACAPAPRVCAEDEADKDGACVAIPRPPGCPPHQVMRDGLCTTPSEPVVSDPAPPQPHPNAAVLLRRALETAAAGQCDASILAAHLIQACTSQQPGLSTTLGGLGPITDITHLVSNNGYDRFAVRHPSTSGSWTVMVGSDGKLWAMVTP